MKEKLLHLICCFAVLLVSAQDASAQGNGCDQECVTLQECPELAELLRKPTRSNIKKLQDATCYIRRTVPFVCCPPPPKTSLLPTDCGQGPSINRIVGGIETNLGDYPWMAVFGYKEIGFDKVEYLCAGSLINDRYILTAAHCVAPDLLSLKKLEVIGLGDWDLTQNVDCQATLRGDRICAPPSQNFTYEEISIHPDYNRRSFQSDDIALIRLSKKVDVSGTWIHPVCLPPQGLSARNAIAKRHGIVTGWGTTENSRSSDRLLAVSVPFVEKKSCNTTYEGILVDEQICMGGELDKDSCGGDSGGPMMARGPFGPPYLQLGVVSYGSSACGVRDFPGVYTDVTFYRDWIEETLRP